MQWSLPTLTNVVLPCHSSLKVRISLGHISVKICPTENDVTSDSSLIDKNHLKERGNICYKYLAGG